MSLAGVPELPELKRALEYLRASAVGRSIGRGGRSSVSWVVHGQLVVPVLLARFSVASFVGVLWASGLSSAGGSSAGLRFSLAIHPPLGWSWFAACVTLLSLFRENLLALGSPFFHVVVRCVVEVDLHVKNPFFC